MTYQRFVITRRPEEEDAEIQALVTLLEQGWRVVAFQALHETDARWAEEIYILKRKE